MPELPEVETIVRDLAQVVGRGVDRVWTSGKPMRLGRPLELTGIRRAARAGRIARVRRRGKYILIEFGAGAWRARPGARTGRPGVLVHLGMSGKLVLRSRTAPREPHTHVVFGLDDDQELRLVDPRRFGTMRPGFPVDDLPEITILGPEPLGPGALDAASLATALRRSRAPVKVFLLDQRRIAGVGNIYASEALFRAAIHPARPSRRVAARAAALLAGVRGALESGIKNRGTTLRDYVDAWGSGGTNRESLLVYGRDGEPCRRCDGRIIVRVTQGRSTYHCPRCQR